MSATPIDTQVAQRRKLRRAMLVLLMVVLAIAAGIFALQRSRGASAPTIDFDEVAAVSLELSPTSTGQPAWQVKYTNPTIFHELLLSLSDGHGVRDHKCADTGHIALHMQDGSIRHYGLLSGHDEAYYEFRLYGERDYEIYRMPRVPFAAAMQKLGVSAIDEPRPE